MLAPPVALPVPSSSTTCLVTGASSGIGADIARELARRGHGVTLVARREERLRELAGELSRAHGIRAETVAADVADRDGRSATIDAVSDRGLTVEVLVNNAGYGSGGRFQDLDMDAEQGMVRLNVEALHSLCAHFVPEMVERGRGAILNLASTAGFQPLPRQATYAATKAFVLSFTEALHADLHGSGVTATALCPGVTRTEFFEAGDVPELAKAPAFAVMDSPDVARAGVDGLDRGKRVVIPGAINRVSAFSGRMTPRSVLVPFLRLVFPVGR